MQHRSQDLADAGNRGFFLDLRQKFARGKPVKRNRTMIGRFSAPEFMRRPDIVSGESFLFSPVSKTRATKTTTKTV
jgi:hypothetical protein